MEQRCRVAVTLEQCWHDVPGGTARAALESIDALLRNPDADRSIEMVGVSARHGTVPDAAWMPSIPVEQLALPRLALYESWHRLRRPRVESATGPVDVIHATGMAVPPASAPLVVTVHDLAFTKDASQFTKRGVRFFTRAIELARRDATLVICPSNATRAECIDYGFDPSRLRLVPWGIEATPVAPADVAAVRARFGITGRYVMWAGTIEPRKNLPVLLDAFDRLGRADVTLVLAGPQGWNEDIQKQLDRLGSRVLQAGFVERRDLAPLYAGADVFCFPSRQEGFGLPVLEAMAQGTAVITSRGTATEEVIGECGVLVDHRDAVSLGDALASLLENESERNQLGEAGRVRARDEFSWSSTAAALRNVYFEAAG
ncbi:RfaG Glycosyltransferase [Acidimicrobiia bacterium]